MLVYTINKTCPDALRWSIIELHVEDEAVRLKPCVQIKKLSLNDAKVPGWLVDVVLRLIYAPKISKFWRSTEKDVQDKDSR